MKKIFTTVALLSMLSLSIAPSFAEPVFGFVYKNATEAGVGYSQAPVTKVGKATCKSYFGIVGLGNCSVNQAAKNGGIRNVSYYDTYTKNILGYKKVTVQAYGN